jgi:beta-galactosidase
VAVSNGDQNSEELNVTNQRRLYNGSALVILRSNREAANPVLTISGEGFKTVKTKLITK